MKPHALSVRDQEAEEITPIEESEGDIDKDTDHEDDNNKVRLKRSLSLFDGVMINVGIMVGTGIFISPKGVVAGVESVGATLCVWVAAGVMSLLGALCYAELGTTIPASGGTYTYIRVIFGDFAGFLNLWAETIVGEAASNAVTALLFSSYCLGPFYPDLRCPPPKMAAKLVAVLCALITLFVNCWSVKLSSLLQNILSICKLLALGIIITSGLFNIGIGHTEHFIEPFASTNISGLGAAMYSCLFSYGGWHVVNVVCEELKNPLKNLPIAAVLSILIVCLVNTLTFLSPAELLKSNAVAFRYAEQVLGSFSVIIPVFVALSCFGSLNGCVLASSRQVLAGVRTGHLPQILAMIGIRHKTPLPSVITSSFLLAVLCFVDDVFTLINFFGFIRWLSFGTAVAGLLVLRYKEPNRQRPFKVNIIIPIIFIIVCISIISFGLYSAPSDSIIAITIVGSGIPVYVWMFRLNPGIKWMMELIEMTLTFVQKVMLIAPEDI